MNSGEFRHRWACNRTFTQTCRCGKSRARVPLQCCGSPFGYLPVPACTPAALACQKGQEVVGKEQVSIKESPAAEDSFPSRSPAVHLLQTIGQVFLCATFPPLAFQHVRLSSGNPLHFSPFPGCLRLSYLPACLLFEHSVPSLFANSNKVWQERRGYF